MALSVVTQPVSRFQYFTYYGSGGDAMSESLIPGKAFELDTVELHLSVACASVLDFVMQLSSALDSAYNMVYLSQAMFGYTNVIWKIARPFIFMYNDTIDFTLPIVNDTNIWGLAAQGWYITS